MKSLIVLATILVCASPYFCIAQTIEPSSNFNNTWLIKPYYDCLAKSNNIHSVFRDSDFFIRHIYISKNVDTLNVSSLNEGDNESFIIHNKNQLYTATSQFCRNPYTLSVVTKDGETLLALCQITKTNNDTIFYVPLGENYRTAHDFLKFINDKFFTGTYVSEDNKYKITFHASGQLEGFYNYNEYRVDVFFSGFIHHDLVYFHNIQRTEMDGLLRRKVVDHKSFNWRKVGRDILLYNLSDEHGFGEVTTLFTKLKKVD